MYQIDATTRAPEGLTLNNPSQARQGAVWGYATRDPACVPEARALIPSVFEEVFLSYDKPALFQQGAVLLFKADPFMVLLLSLDIVHYLIFVVDAVGECCILVSPAFEIGEGRIGLKPLAGKGLDGLYVMRHRYGCRERNENMHVVGHTTNAVNLSLQVVGLCQDNCIELAVVLDGDGLLTPICAEHNMIERLDITHIGITRYRAKYCNGFESASLRDAGGSPRDNPTLRCACAGLLRVCASGTHRRSDRTNFRRSITEGSKGDYRTHKAA